MLHPFGGSASPFGASPRTPRTPISFGSYDTPATIGARVRTSSTQAETMDNHMLTAMAREQARLGDTVTAPAPMPLGVLTLAPVTSRGLTKTQFTPSAGMQWPVGFPPPSTRTPFQTAFRSEAMHADRPGTPFPAAHAERNASPFSHPQRGVPSAHMQRLLKLPNRAPPHGFAFNSSPHATHLDFGHSYNDNRRQATF